jgi:sulfide:quinone oxidoreductase
MTLFWSATWIESMVTATTQNIANELKGGKPDERGSWIAVCLADFGDTGVAFVALPQIPPHNTNWASRGGDRALL